MARDFLQNFIFKDRDVRGSFVRLENSYQTILNQHHYPRILEQVLAEALLGVTLMAPNFQNPGKITLQFQGGENIRLVSASITSDYKIRGLVRVLPDSVLSQDIRREFASGQMTLTYEPLNGQAYQSIIPFTSSVPQSLESYFVRSEQLATQFFIASDDSRAASLMLQALPASSPESLENDFEHCAHLAATLSAHELFDLDLKTVLHRLFHDVDIMLFDEKPLAFGCNCSRECMENIVKSLGQDEANSILAEHGFIEVVCEFCSEAQQFDAVQIKRLFAT